MAKKRYKFHGTGPVLFVNVEAQYAVQVEPDAEIELPEGVTLEHPDLEELKEPDERPRGKDKGEQTGKEG